MYKIIKKTGLGWIGVSGSRNSVITVILPRKTRGEVFRLLPGGDNKAEAVPEFLTDLAARLGKYFAGEKVRFSDKLDYGSATDFQKDVWKETMMIPYGEIRTYGWIAKQIGCRSARAVGQALGKNPFPVIIPCHRVIGSDGKLTGFAGGLKLKERLLNMEKAV
jgi:methylated-DNA-[protein]-cysteine S-methyltransferase